MSTSMSRRQCCTETMASEIDVISFVRSHFLRCSNGVDGDVCLPASHSAEEYKHTNWSDVTFKISSISLWSGYYMRRFSFIQWKKAHAVASMLGTLRERKPNETVSGLRTQKPHNSWWRDSWKNASKHAQLGQNYWATPNANIDWRIAKVISS